jgi:tetratricopeptide (TPR) repeat protein
MAARAVPVVCLALGALAGCISPADSFNTRGVSLFNSGQVESAHSEFLQAASADPVNADAFYNLASTYHRLGNGAEAERNYMHCLALAPDHTKAHHAYTVMLLEQKRSNEAFDLTQRWIDQSPGNPDPMVEMAWLEKQAGHSDKAQELLHQVIAANPKHPRALTELASIYESNNDSGRALALYQRALAADPNHAGLTTRIADLRGSVEGSESNRNAANPYSPPDSSRASRDMRFQMR